ncbi:MAG: UbiA prenyltransferase family protein [Bacteroidetes bacterium]|nr:UbiA prenyltransferase family protein [Bacteroidota bacterium]
MSERIKISKIDSDTLKLLRIPFSFFLMPVFFLALSQVPEVNWTNAILCFFILHLFIYPSSNGYNSYMDQDVTSIGGLEHPPKPTKKLFYTSIIFDVMGLSLSLFINIQFFIYVALYIIASRAYSFKGIRLKKFAIAGFLTVVFFQGAFTFWMVYSAISNYAIALDNILLMALIGCSFLIGGIYPLTQVYQHDADSLSGDFTISYKLGINGTFIFSAIMFVIANFFFYFYFDGIDKIKHFIYLQLFLFPVIVYFLIWFYKVIKNKNQASFKNMMNMNFIAATAMNVCFILLLILNITG